MTDGLLHPGPATIDGFGLTLRPWDEELVRQLAAWGERGFPYHPFDLGRLRDPQCAADELLRMRTPGPHLYYVACEGETAVGRVAVNLEDPAGLYLWAVHVPPEHEGRGVCRRMLAALMTHLEQASPGRLFVLNANAFADRALKAYAALGFEIAETRWHFDPELAAELWRAPAELRRRIAGHIRFHAGRWEVRTHLMVRSPGAPMEVPAPLEVSRRSD